MASDWNGVPDKPHDDGWHWVKTRHGIASDRPRHWWGSIARWELSDGTLIEPAECTDGWCYLGPCLTPADHAAAVEAAVQAERERLIGCCRAEMCRVRSMDHGPTDALAAALATARVEALEEAAVYLDGRKRAYETRADVAIACRDDEGIDVATVCAAMFEAAATAIRAAKDQPA